jgi:hypothetical protein
MQRAQRRKYHYIYKTTCIITNRFYIGMHSTDNLEDGYVGSGKRLWHSINKHGRENHVCEILEFLPDRDSLKAREKEIVNQEMLNEELCMNLAIGGEGGWLNEEHKKSNIKAFTAAGRLAIIELRKNPEWQAKTSKNMSISQKAAYFNGKLAHLDWTNRKHSEQTIQKMKESHKDSHNGDKNSQFGTRWITNEIESKKILKGDSIPEGWRLGRKIK